MSIPEPTTRRIDPDSIAPLAVSERARRRELTRSHPRADRSHESSRTDRRTFLRRAGMAAAAVGLSSFVVTERLSRPASAGNYDLKPNDCAGVSTSWYASNPATVPCGHSPICNSISFQGGCRDLNGWHRKYVDGNGDGWSFRNDECPNAPYDGWSWKNANWGGCSTAEVRCHDGVKVIGWTPSNTIAAHRLKCW